jgi:hypothetical protein
MINYLRCHHWASSIRFDALLLPERSSLVVEELVEVNLLEVYWEFLKKNQSRDLLNFL